MDEKFITEEEIRDAIISKTTQNKIIKLSSISTNCSDENMFFKVLNELIQEGKVVSDGNFIFLPKQP